MESINQSNVTTANPSINQILSTSFTVIVMLVGIVGNFMNLYYIYKIPALHSYNNMFIAHLAVADFLQTSLTLPMAIANSFLASNIPHALCQAFAFTLNFLLAVALAGTAAISIDRCIAVVYPYQYIANMKLKYIIIIIVLIWLLALLMAGVPLLGLEYYGLGEYTFIADGLQCWFDFQHRRRSNVIFIILFIYLLLTILTTMVSYFIIFFIACHKGISDISAVGYASLNRSIRTTALIVGSNLICFIPSLVSVSISFFTQRELQPGLTIAAYLLSFCNSAINPIIYSLTNEILRRKIKRRCSKLCNRCCSKGSIPYSGSKICPEPASTVSQINLERRQWQTVVNSFQG